MNDSFANPSQSLTILSSVNKRHRVRQKIAVHHAKAKAKGTAANNANVRAINAAAVHHNANSKIVANDQQLAVMAKPNAAAAAAPVPLANALDNNNVLAPLVVSVHVESFRFHADYVSA